MWRARRLAEAPRLLRRASGSRFGPKKRDYSTIRGTVYEAHDLIKLVLVGDSGAGKTALMLRFVRDQFVTSTRATVGMDFCTRQLAVDAMQARPAGGAGLETASSALASSSLGAM